MVLSCSSLRKKNMKKTERVDKLLANLGYCSRRSIAEFLKLHMVMAGTARIRDGSIKVLPDEITIDGVSPDFPQGIFILMNKPAGYVCSHDEGEGARVYDLLPAQWMKRNPCLSTIGRLDRDTTGALLITDIPGVNHALTAPSRSIEKVYAVTLDRAFDAGDMPRLTSGTLILTGETKPCLPATIVQAGERLVEITLCEGRYHQVKRMFGHCGYEVVALHRVRFGTWTVDGIPEGSFVHPEFPEGFRAGG